MAFVKIQLNGLGYLDVEDGTAFPLTFDNAPIQDISKRSGTFSKSITLADTANNRKLLGYLFDANVTESSFNQNVKAPCSVIQNGVNILPNAYLQLKSILKRSPALVNGDQKINFIVAIRSDNGDFYSSMAEKLLTDLDFSQYDHIYTWSAITATSAHTYLNAYKYHNFFHAGGNYKLTDYKPGIFLLPYIDRIVSGGGYTYEWSDATDVGADKMIVPYSGDKPKFRIEEVDEKRFRAGFSGGQQTIALTSSTLSGRTIKWDDDSTRENFDSGSTYSPATGKYTGDYFGSTLLKAKFQYELYLSASTDVTMSINSAWGGAAPGAVLGKNYSAQAFFYKNGSGAGISPATTFDTFSYLCGTTLSSGLTYVKSGITSELLVNPSAFAATGYNIYPGAEFQLALNSSSSDVVSGYIISMAWKNSGGTPTNVYMVVKVGAVSADTSNNYFFNEPTITDINEGETVFMNDYVAPKVKQKEFFADVVKAFNLYITPDKDKANHLVIQTRDNFYDSGQEIDWTNKFAVDREYTLTQLPDLQKKKLQFTYKGGAADVWNKNYFAATTENYGQLEYTFENEFVKDIQKIDLAVFEPTPIDKDLTFGNLVSLINSEAPKTGLRLLYDCGWISGNTWNFSDLTGPGYTTRTYSDYPAALHFYPNAVTPTDDLNFGICDYYYYDNWTYLTNNNLYNKHYKRFINQIETGKLLTGLFRLNELDIANLDFRNKIWIHNKNWFLNKIIDYDANSKDGLTKCELISIDEGTRFEPTQQREILKPSLGDTGPVYLGNDNLRGDNSNNISSPVSGLSLKGIFNTTQPGTRNVFLGGDENNVFAKNSVILGTGNTVFDSTNSIIAGNNITVDAGVNNVFVFGDNISATTSNTMYATNLIVSGSFSASSYPAVATGTTGSTAGIVKLSSGRSTVTTSAVTMNSYIFLSTQMSGSTLQSLGHHFILSRSANTSFNIQSTSPTDDSWVAWNIVEPY